MSSSAISNKTGLEVAIIGMAGRFPGARNLTEFWQRLRDGVDAITFFSDDELKAADVNPAVLRKTNYVKANHVLEDIDLFDAQFFDFNPREAEITDPQQRIFLECACEALENAGHDSMRFEGAIGVYGGVSINTYLFNLLANRELINALGNYQAVIGNDKDFLTTHVSYKLNLKGPSVTIQTACSTSLVAVHLACQALLSGECDIALAGGVSVKVPQETGYWYQEGGILSPDGHCRAFDARAQGTTSGNGAGIVVLRRLEDALAHGDHIEAVIRGSAVNNDGSVKIGYTAPSIEGQAQVIRTALVMAGLEDEVETITYVEAHGTGTVMGDPIEVAALTKAFEPHSRKKNFCGLGSVKTNIGHQDAAAGVAGLIKTVLALKHKALPPSLHFEHPNPAIDFDNSPFYVNGSLRDWNSENAPRRAGVSAFGIGGTNAHLILEEAPTVESSASSRLWHLLPLSAQTKTALATMTANLAAHLKQHPKVNLADVAYTLQVGRREFENRRALVCQDVAEAIAALEAPDEKHTAPISQKGEAPPVVFMFPGQGSQQVNMGRELYQNEPVFRAQVDRCSELLAPQLKLDLRQVLFPMAPQTANATERLGQTELAQPALFVIEYALARLLVHWGLHPTAVIGHSLGEYIAACFAGVFSLEDGLSLVAARGRLAQRLPGGAMLAVALDENETKARLSAGLSLAAANSPAQSVVSGSFELIADLAERLNRQGVACRRLPTSHAFHSALIEPMLEPLMIEFGKVALHEPQLPYVSNTTGRWITAEQATSVEYWAQHARETVRFAEGLENFVTDPRVIFVEVGPGRSLSSIARECAPMPARLMALNTLLPESILSPSPLLLRTLAQLWSAGVPVDWKAFSSSGQRGQRRRVELPTYPFERKRFWIDKRVSSAPPSAVAAVKKPDIADWFYTPVWKRSAPARLSLQRLSDKPMTWLIFADECGIGEGLATHLTASGQRVITVRPGEHFSRDRDRLYHVAPDQRNHYQKLLRDLRNCQQLPQRIVYLWGLTPEELTAQRIESTEPNEKAEPSVSEVQRNFYSVLFLAQGLGAESFSESIELLIVANGLQEVSGDEELHPAQATLLGCCRVIAQEYPRITCRSIDVSLPPAGGEEKRKLIEVLVSELMASRAEQSVAYRGGYRWAQTYQAVRLEEPPAENRLRRGGVYLITGGLGRMGQVLAQELARLAQAKLVLVGRQGLPEREIWNRWVAEHGEFDMVSRKMKAVQKAEQSGAEVLVVEADVSREEEMRAALKRAKDRFGPINGVIHAAGNSGVDVFSPIGEIEGSACELQFRSKIYGLIVLEKVLREEELDFCLLMSSLASQLGGLGFVAYAAANQFMDAFAYKHNRRSSVAWTSINWDGWRYENEAKSSNNPGVAQSEMNILPKEGADAFLRILAAQPLTQIIVSTGDLQNRSARWINPELPHERELLSTAGPTSSHPRTNLSSDYVAPRNDLERSVTHIWQQLLGIEAPGVNDNFFELGGQSLLAAQVISRLREAYQIELRLRSFFEKPTISEMAKEIERLLIEEIRELPEEEAWRLIHAEG